jgi:SAM-dependent methyltransferase
MARRSLLDLFFKLGRRGYDFIHRRELLPETGPRPELVDLVELGRVSPGSAIDLGCGTGADTVFLAGRGFDVVGVDISPVALAKARERAERAGCSPRFVEGDLLDLPGEISGPFDLIFDGGTLDDFPQSRRPELAAVIAGLARPRSVFVMWCFYAAARDLPRLSLSGASRWGAPAIEPGEEQELFGEHWEIERLTAAAEDGGTACFVMTRR